MRAHFTPQAEIDLEEVGDYIALDNPGRAVSFIREMRQHCEKIAGGPDHYAARPDLGDTIRICAHGNYLIVFEPFGTAQAAVQGDHDFADELASSASATPALALATVYN